ncbi:MAG: hypothetical protein KGL75_11225 [Acidobacteriota bacterium]|nr:hypothetical protein [Acidobacteriota bacterium]
MSGSVMSGMLLGLMILAAAVLILGPLTALAFMFWHWQKELKASMRMRQARTTQVR